MKFNKKLLAMGICAGLSLTMLTGCASKAPNGKATVATMDGEKLPLGVANLMYRYSQATSGSYISALVGMDTATLWTQDLVGTGTPYGMTLKDSVLDEYKRMSILEKHMSEYGVEITEEDKAKISEAADKFIADNDKEALEQMSGTKENVERLLTLYLVEERMQHAVEDSAEVEVTDEEAAQKRIRYAYFAVPQPEAAEEETEAVSEAAEETEAVSEAAEETEAVSEAAEETEAVSEAAEETETESETKAAPETPEKTAMRATVQGLIDEIKGGKTFDEVVEAFDPEKNIVENTYGATTTSLSEALRNAADELSDGEICSVPVEVENGFYIVEMVSTFDADATEEERQNLINQKKSDYFYEMLDSWEPESFDVDQAVWDTVNYAQDFYTPLPAETEAVSEAEEVTEAASEAEEVTEAASEAAEEVTEAASETEAVTEAESESEA